MAPSPTYRKLFSSPPVGSKVRHHTGGGKDNLGIYSCLARATHYEIQVMVD